jgi:hypothetical protein
MPSQRIRDDWHGKFCMEIVEPGGDITVMGWMGKSMGRIKKYIYKSMILVKFDGHPLRHFQV